MLSPEIPESAEVSRQYRVRKGLDELLSGVASLEDYFCQSTPPVVIKPIYVVASAPSAKAISCDAMADMLKNLVTRFEAKNKDSVSSSVGKSYLSLSQGSSSNLRAMPTALCVV